MKTNNLTEQLLTAALISGSLFTFALLAGQAGQRDIGIGFGLVALLTGLTMALNALLNVDNP